jgi:diguanylate cyclase (GGDEF)-like protein
MISLKKYLDQAEKCPGLAEKPDADVLLVAALAAYRSALMEIAGAGADACPSLGEKLNQSLNIVEQNLCPGITLAQVENAAKSVQQQLQNWGTSASVHYKAKTSEIRELLILMAHTAESVGERDQRCAAQIENVTNNLRMIANLDDLTLIRASIESSAAELKTSIDIMTAEGKAAIDHLRNEVSHYQIKLEEAESVASRDSLTGLRTRLFVENQIERRIALNLPSCVAIIDIDGFKQVNDDHGHLVGDALLRLFSAELKAACRTTDMIGRWGGDEFIILLDCDLQQAQAQTDRLRQWITGNYTVPGKCGPLELKLNASLGLAEHLPNETLNGLLARADAEMYQHKSWVGTKGKARKDSAPAPTRRPATAAP